MNFSIWCIVIFYNLKEFFDVGLMEIGFKRFIMDKIFFLLKNGCLEVGDWEVFSFYNFIFWY